MILYKFISQHSKNHHYNILSQFVMYYFTWIEIQSQNVTKLLIETQINFNIAAIVITECIRLVSFQTMIQYSSYIQSYVIDIFFILVYQILLHKLKIVYFILNLFLLSSIFIFFQTKMFHFNFDVVRNCIKLIFHNIYIYFIRSTLKEEYQHKYVSTNYYYLLMLFQWMLFWTFFHLPHFKWKKTVEFHRKRQSRKCKIAEIFSITIFAFDFVFYFIFF